MWATAPSIRFTRSQLPLAELRRTVQVVGSLIRGEEARIDGKSLYMPWAKRNVPIYIASTGQKSLRLAGELADGVIINVGAHADLVNWALEHLEEGASEGGGKLKDLDIWIRVTCYPHNDARRARDVIKGAAAAKANGLARYAKDASFRKHLSPALMTDIENLAKNYDYYKHESREARHSNLVTDRILETLVIAGPSHYCVSRIKEIIDETGVNQFSFATYGFPNLQAFVPEFAREVMRPLG